MIPKPLYKGFKIHQWTRIAVSIAVLVYLSVLGFSYYFPQLNSQVILLLVGLIFLGMPHGAMDIFLAYKTIRSSLGIKYFISAYLFLGTSIVALWLLSPTLGFLFFLAYSLFHFADSDLQKGILDSKLNFLEFSTRLPIPFCVSMIFFPKETSQLVQLLHSEIQISNLTKFFQVLGFTGIVLTLVFTGIHLVKMIKNFSKSDLTFLEPLVLVILFSQVEPLFALGIYFSFIHAVKHVMNVLRHLDELSFKSILPFWLLPLLGVPVIFGVYLSFESSLSQHQLESYLYSYMILILAFLAFPHAVLVRYCKLKGLIR